MLTAEHVVTRSNRAGYTTLEWVKTRPRNEALDCRIYAMAAALALGVDRFTEASWNARESLAGETARFHRGRSRKPHQRPGNRPRRRRTGDRRPGRRC